MSSASEGRQSTDVVLSGQVKLGQVQPMPGAWKQHLDASLRLDGVSSGCPLALCGKPPLVEWTATFGYSHYAYGRWLLGRQSSLASGVVQASSTFPGDSVGSDRCDALLAGACPRLRPLSLTWDGPTYGDWTPSLQLAAGGGPASLTARVDLALPGGYLMAAHVARADGTAITPLGLSLRVGRWRLSALRNGGDVNGEHRRHTSIGLATPLAHGEWQLQAARHHEPASAGWRKLTTGYERSLDFKRSWRVDVAELRRAGQPRHLTIGVGLRWER